MQPRKSQQRCAQIPKHTSQISLRNPTWHTQGHIGKTEGTIVPHELTTKFFGVHTMKTTTHYVIASMCTNKLNPLLPEVNQMSRNSLNFQALSCTNFIAN